jgi:hypothetical protein
VAVAHPHPEHEHPPAPHSAPPHPAHEEPEQAHVLTRDDMLAVLKGKAAQFDACNDAQPDLNGTLSVSTAINRDGTVVQAQVVTARFRGTPVGDCVERTLRSARFPAFAGDPMRVILPLTLH